MPRIRYLLLCLIFLICFFPAVGAKADDYTWLDSPTSPRKTCGFAWSENNPAGRQPFHNAIDFCGGHRGGNVLAVADGVVVYADWWPKSTQANGTGHGWMLAIWHPRNRIYSYYSHLQEFKVAVGQEVYRGDIIGLEGDSGFASGPHVHFPVATKDPETMVNVDSCGKTKEAKISCWPNPDDFLGKDVVATDLGLTTFGPDGTVYQPEPGTPIYPGSAPVDASGTVVSNSLGSLSYGDLTFDLVDKQGEDHESSTFDIPGFVSKNTTVIYFGSAAFVLLFVLSEQFRKGTLYLLAVVVILGLILFILASLT